jgi:cell division protein ZapA (FtsZ GTPase activity inhibitor)
LGCVWQIRRIKTKIDGGEVRLLNDDEILGTVETPEDVLTITITWEVTMQTELNTAKDEKLVDLDVSGEGAEVELEDKSHGAVAPEKYEEVKTEEKDPLEPAVVQEEQQSEEMDQYSDKVKKRIDKLTFKVREAEREREAALVFAQNVQKELSEAKSKTYDIDKGYMGESEVRNKMASDLSSSKSNCCKRSR